MKSHYKDEKTEHYEKEYVSFLLHEMRQSTNDIDFYLLMDQVDKENNI